MTGQAKPKNRPTDCPAPSPFQPGLLSLTTPKKASLMLPRATTARGTVALTNVLPNAPLLRGTQPGRALSTCQLPRKRQELRRGRRLLGKPDAGRLTRGTGRSRRSRPKTKPDPASSPSRRSRAFPAAAGEAVGAGTLPVPGSGHRARRPHRRDPPAAAPVPAEGLCRPPRAPASPPRPAGGCAGLGAAAPARKAPRPRRPAPHLRACG